MTVTCTRSNCPNFNVPYSVPDDGLPVTCGGCRANLAPATQD